MARDFTADLAALLHQLTIQSFQQQDLRLGHKHRRSPSILYNVAVGVDWRTLNIVDKISDFPALPFAFGVGPKDSLDAGGVHVRDTSIA